MPHEVLGRGHCPQPLGSRRKENLATRKPQDLRTLGSLYKHAREKEPVPR